MRFARTIALPLAAASLVLPAAATAKTAATARPSGLDIVWVGKAIQGDRFEVAGGKMATRRSTDPAVRALAARLEVDHSADLKKMIALARTLGVKVPKTPTASQQWELAAVSSMSGKGFDVAYASLEVQDHKDDIEDAKGELDLGSQNTVQAMAKKALVMYRAHLALSQKTLKAVR
jgi:putative membrane protein